MIIFDHLLVRLKLKLIVTRVMIIFDHLLVRLKLKLIVTRVMIIFDHLLRSERSHHLWIWRNW